MRTFAILSLFFALLSTESFATSVLLPECSGDNCPSYNYGLTPSLPKKETKDSSVFQPPAQDLETSIGAYDQQQKKTMEDQQTQQTNIKITPGGKVVQNAEDEKQKKLNEFIKATGINSRPITPKVDDPRLQKYLAEQQRRKNKPPLILADTDTPEDEVLGREDLPNSLSILLRPSYTWGAKDVEKINRDFGFQQKEIPANCQLRIDSTIKTDRGIYSGKTYSGQRSVAKYDGNIKEIELTPKAVCNAPSLLPNNGGIIQRVGDKLSIILYRWAKCVPQTSRKIVALNLQYDGDGQIKCIFD